MLGSPSLAQWGTPFWGDVAFEPSQFVKLESIARGELQRTLAFDCLAEALGVELTAGFDSLGQATGTISVGFDVYQGRVPTAEFLADCTANVLLIEMRLPAGTRRFASLPLIFGGDQYEGRTVTVTQIGRTVGRGTDDLQIQLDDTDQDGQERLRDVFLADPPEGSGVTVWVVLLNDKARNRYQLFEGRIEKVTGFSRAVVSIDVVRSEAVEDVELGRPVDLVDYPNAPDDSLSRMRPIVYGEVEEHEGVAVNVNALSRLAQPLAGPSLVPSAPGLPNVVTLVQTPSGLIAQVSNPNEVIELRDASEFPASGVVFVDDEQVAYTGKVGDQLTGLTRGFNGTFYGEHKRGVEVREVGEFVALFADHALSKLENVRILGSDGVLGEPVPAPASIDYQNALVTWDETPKVRQPNADSEFQRVHFRDVDPISFAPGAEFSARENPGYRAFGVAQLGVNGAMILRTNTSGLGVPGDLLRVYICCIFDPETLGIVTANPPLLPLANGFFTVNPNFNPAIPPTAVGIFGGASVLVAGKAFNLQATDLVPEVIARNDEKTGDRLYDVPDPVFAPEIGDTGDRILSPDRVIDPGIWQDTGRASLIIDGDEATEAVSFFAGVGEAALIGRADAIFRLEAPPDLGDFKPVSGTLVFIAGWGPPFTPITSPMQVSIVERATGKLLASLEAQTVGPAGLGVGLIRDIERFEAPIDIDLIEDDLANLEDFDWIVSPTTGVSAGLWVARELYIELEVEEDPPINKATIDPKGTVTNYFDVTDLVGLSKTGDVRADWAFFSDLNRGGRAVYRANVPNVNPQIIETFWVAEFVPFLEASSKIPRAFADVRGLTGQAGADTPADIAEQVITRPVPIGMGLPPSRLKRDTYNATKASLLADGIRHGFALRSTTSAVSLIEEIAEQGDCRQTWERGNHLLIRRPRADTSLPVFKTLTESFDILVAPIKLGRTSRREARTRVTLLYRPFAPTGDTSRSVEQVDAVAESSNLGRQGETLTYGLVRDDTTAQELAQRLVERKSKPRWSVEVEMSLPALELRFGDLVSIQHKDIPGGGFFEVCEVVGLNYSPGGFDTLTVTCVVWKA